MIGPVEEESARPPFPARLQREQQALGLILGLRSRSLAICVTAAASYPAYLAWSRAPRLSSYFLPPHLPRAKGLKLVSRS